MDFDLSDLQLSWQQKAQLLGRDLASDVSAAGVVVGAARAGLLDPRIDLLSAAVAVEALAEESAAAAVALALHTGVVLGTSDQERFATLIRGEVVAAIGLSSDEMPVEQNGRLSGRATWVTPLTDHGVAVIGARTPAS